MFHDSAMNCENFQDLELWCDKKCLTVPPYDFETETKSTERADDTNTIHNTTSPPVWDLLDANFSNGPISVEAFTPIDVLSPDSDVFTNNTGNSFDFPSLDQAYKRTYLPEQVFDISNMPIVVENMDLMEDVNATAFGNWEVVDDAAYTELTNYTDTHNKPSTLPFIDEEDTLGEDFKLISPSVSMVMMPARNNDISQLAGEGSLPGQQWPVKNKRVSNLKLDVTSQPIGWFGDPVINTPDVLNCVEQLENEKTDIEKFIATKLSAEPTSMYTELVTVDTCPDYTLEADTINYKPVFFKDELSPIDIDTHSKNAFDFAQSLSKIDEDSTNTVKHSSSPKKRRRHDSEDSDETYTPYTERTPVRKNSRRKPSLPIEEVLQSPEIPVKAKRGRPPKRRESTTSTCTLDDSISCTSTHEDRYRELRDKNNEASKRSRMNRKQKEIAMDRLASDLEERNNKLRVKAEILEDMTKRLKDALMTAILSK